MAKISMSNVSIDEEVWNKWAEKIEQDNVARGCVKTEFWGEMCWNATDRTYAEIWVSGPQQSYFTFWKHYSNGVQCVNKEAAILHNGGDMLIAHDSYIQNLSQDFEGACQKAMDKLKGTRTPLVLSTDGSSNKYKYDYSEDLFHFGKYEGKNIFEVAEEDINYIIYMAKWLQEKKDEGTTRYGRFGHSTFSKKMQTTLDKCEIAKNIFFENLKEKNRTESKSNYLGEVGGKVENIELHIDKIVDGTDSFDGNVRKEIYCTCGGENKVVFYVKFGTENFNREFTPKSTITIKKGVIKGCYEKLGVKHTRLSNVKF